MLGIDFDKLNTMHRAIEKNSFQDKLLATLHRERKLTLFGRD